jgi:hypothetical protein
MPKRYQFKTSCEFTEKLNRVSRESGLSKPEAIVAGIELLDRLVQADKEGKEFAIVSKPDN